MNKLNDYSCYFRLPISHFSNTIVFNLTRIEYGCIYPTSLNKSIEEIDIDNVIEILEDVNMRLYRALLEKYRENTLTILYDLTLEKYELDIKKNHPMLPILFFRSLSQMKLAFLEMLKNGDMLKCSI